MAPSKSHHQVAARTPAQNPKATHLRPSAQHTLAVLGHGRPCSQKHFTWGLPENCSKASVTYIYRYLSRSKKKRFHSTVSYAVWFYCSTLFLPFQQNIASLVITPWPWCLTCKECQKSHHFFQLQRLVRSKYISLIFKPWQPCCFRTEMQYIHSPSMTTFATTLSFKSEKLNPKIMPLLVAGLRNLDNGWLWYEEICSACLLLGQAYILPTSGCNLSHSRKNFQIRWKKKLARIQQCSIKVLHVLIPWKGTKENSQTACHHYDNFLTGLLIGLGGSHLALFAAEFSVESCYLPYLLRETDQQPGQKSIWAKSHLLKSGNQWRSKQLQGTFGRTPSRTKMVAKVWLTYQMDTFQVTTKPGKKTCYHFLQASRTLRIHGGNSLQVCSESAHKHHGTHSKPLTLHLTSGTCSLGIFQRLSRTCKTKDERTHTKMNDVKKFK